jgi:hypothetical protein
MCISTVDAGERKMLLDKERKALLDNLANIPKW